MCKKKQEEKIMKKKFITKALAAALSASMAFSMSSAVPMTAASAAAKVVRLNTTYKTLRVGQKDYKLRLVSNTLNWKIKKASTTNKKIAMVYGKKASYVLLLESKKFYQKNNSSIWIYGIFKLPHLRKIQTPRKELFHV